MQVTYVERTGRSVSECPLSILAQYQLPPTRQVAYCLCFIIIFLFLALLTRFRAHAAGRVLPLLFLPADVCWRVLTYAGNRGWLVRDAKALE